MLLINGSLYPLTRTTPVFSTRHQGIGGPDKQAVLRRFAGLPEDARVYSIKKKADYWLLLTYHKGAFFHFKGSRRWWPLQNGLPCTKAGILPFVDITMSPNGRSFFAVSAHSIWRYSRSARRWSRIPSPQYSPYNTFTAIVQFNVKKQQVLAVGTSYNGVQFGFIGQQNVVKWKRRAAGLPGWATYRNVVTYETVAALFQDNNDHLIAVPAFGGNMYRFDPERDRWNKTAYVIPQGCGRVTAVHNVNNRIVINGTKGIYTLYPGGKKSKKISLKKQLNRLYSRLQIDWIGDPDSGINFRFQNPVKKNGETVDISSEKKRRMERAANKKAFYVRTALLLRPGYLERLLPKMKKYGINAIVVDMKDDNGKIMFDSTNRVALQTGALKASVKLQNLQTKLKKFGIYLIARIVVFKDRNMFNYMNCKYAIRDIHTGKPWIGGDTHSEYWVDPHADFVHRYNISIAAELAGRGVDEIQFDYIRFPTDGNVFRCKYPYNTAKSVNKSSVLVRFLKAARKVIKVPLSIDIYGFSGWYRMGDRMGQDITELSRFVDVVSPMYYPSHFGPKFFNRDPYAILLHGTRRAVSLAGSNVIIRPWLQAFWRARGKYILDQIKGTVQGGGSGYLFWNINGRYNRVFFPLAVK